jgi:hypothetical protein
MTPDERELQQAWGIPVTVLRCGARLLVVVRDEDMAQLFRRPYREAEDRAAPGQVVTRSEVPDILRQHYGPDGVALALLQIDTRLASASAGGSGGDVA